MSLRLPCILSIFVLALDVSLHTLHRCSSSSMCLHLYVFIWVELLLEEDQFVKLIIRVTSTLLFIAVKILIITHVFPVNDLMHLIEEDLFPVLFKGGALSVQSSKRGQWSETLEDKQVHLLIELGVSH